MGSRTSSPAPSSYITSSLCSFGLSHFSADYDQLRERSQVQWQYQISGTEKVCPDAASLILKPAEENLNLKHNLHYLQTIITVREARYEERLKETKSKVLNQQYQLACAESKAKTQNDEISKRLEAVTQKLAESDKAQQSMILDLRITAIKDQWHEIQKAVLEQQNQNFEADAEILRRENVQLNFQGLELRTGS
jgi:hypothetical protein